MARSVRKFRLRFNLGAGINYQKWQLSNDLTGEVTYYDPDAVCLILTNSKLRNQSATACKIYSGANKTVCAWIDAESVAIVPTTTIQISGKQNLSYNPKITPNWVLNSKNVDNKLYDTLLTCGRSIYVP